MSKSARPSLRSLLTRSTPEPAPAPVILAIEDAQNPPVPLRPGDFLNGGLTDDDRSRLLATLKSHRPEPVEAAPAKVVPAEEPPVQPARPSAIDTVLKEAMQIEGAIGIALVDYSNGRTLGRSGGAKLDLGIAAAGNTELVRAKLRTMEVLGLREGIEDILITLETQYHLIRPIPDSSGAGLFLYMALDKQRSNLALARRELAGLEATLQV